MEFFILELSDIDGAKFLMENSIKFKCYFSLLKSSLKAV